MKEKLNNFFEEKYSSWKSKAHQLEFKYQSDHSPRSESKQLDSRPSSDLGIGKKQLSSHVKMSLSKSNSPPEDQIPNLIEQLYKWDSPGTSTRPRAGAPSAIT